MASPIFLYPSLTEDLRSSVFQSKPYVLSYEDAYGNEKDLEYEPSEISSLINCIKTDGVWDADKNNLYIRRTIALRKYQKLFGPDGIACRTAKLGVSMVWTSSDSRQRGAQKIMIICADEACREDKNDHSFAEGELDFEFTCAMVRGDVSLSIVIYIAEAGCPCEDETHLANEEGFVLGEFDSLVLRFDGTGSLFPVFEVHDSSKPLWYVRCDWTDVMTDSFADAVSINLNTAHPDYKYINSTEKTFCMPLLRENLSAALCCIIEKIRSEGELDHVLGEQDLETGSVAEAIRYFFDTFGWDFSSPEKMSLDIRKFFEERMKQ